MDGLEQNWTVILHINLSLQANSHAPVMEMSGTITMEDTMPMDDLVDSGEQGNNLYSILDQECLLEVFDEITTNYPDQGNALGNISNPGSPTGDSVPHNTSSINGQFVSTLLRDSNEKNLY